jgi:DNA-directed RNA polymerase specialized sigma24 family protein
MSDSSVVRVPDPAGRFDLLYAAAAVRLLAYTRSRSAGRGEEIAQETWTRAWKMLQANRSVEIPWLFTVAAHLGARLGRTTGPLSDIDPAAGLLASAR